MSHIFPKSANRLPLQIIIFLVVFGGIVTAATTYYATPKYTRIGYAPVQPVPFSHAKHNGELGIDCRYCHSTVEKAGHAAVPTAQTCMNCHSQVKNQSPLLAPVRASYESGDPVEWVRVHQAPDYVYFDHSVHVNRGVSCVECHGQINEMEVVTHSKPLSMGFCLDCHRDPAPRLRDPKLVTQLDWKHPGGEDGQRADGEKFIHDWNIHPPQSCSGCHR
ncbi:cytochrome c3 family protein [Actomonas aquatica]|uniref:Cytochrome c3 family protein n=1 Tax=Actomonas aquatica TaxID=2866162 RepID=A0ABZ1CBC7_9BACT|nr:cytochrome c3 family protein [Opitutus sp. WL0086]WRQ88978.1 cytochrome c3 family protein [Opitutus sp. WL0086]